jgi:hypothetical protein
MGISPHTTTAGTTRTTRTEAVAGTNQDRSKS